MALSNRVKGAEQALRARQDAEVAALHPWRTARDLPLADERLRQALLPVAAAFWALAPREDTPWADLLQTTQRMGTWATLYCIAMANGWPHWQSFSAHEQDVHILATKYTLHAQLAEWGEQGCVRRWTKFLLVDSGVRAEARRRAARTCQDGHSFVTQED